MNLRIAGKIKTKIRLGFLIVVVTLLVAIGVYQITLIED